MPSSTNSHGADLSLSLSESSSRICEACLWYCSRDSTKEDSWLTCSTYIEIILEWDKTQKQHWPISSFFTSWLFAFLNGAIYLPFPFVHHYNTIVHRNSFTQKSLKHLIVTRMKTVNTKHNRLDKLTLQQVTLEKKNKAYHLTHTVLWLLGWEAESRMYLESM